MNRSTLLPLQDDLKHLFRLDQQVRGLRSRLDAATRRRDLQQNKLEQLQRQHGELGEQHKHAQARAASLEHQSNDVEQRVVTHREQMNTVTSNKEYSALLVEVSTLKLEKSKLEDEALQQLAEVDTVKQRIEEIASQIDDQQKLVTGAETEVAEARDEVGDRLEAVQTERDAAAAGVPGDVLATFDRLGLQHDGEALAEVEEQDRRRREYCCGGCYIQLPVERINTLMTRPDQLVQCPSCHRYLFMAEELKAALVPK